jgi:benzoate-CoA ligase family protein
MTSRLPDRFNAATLFVDRHVSDGRGARRAFRYAGRTVTYGEVAESVAHTAGALAGLGVEMENRVLLALHDQPAFVATFWGTVKLGAIAVPVNTLMTAEEYEFLLNDSRAKVAVVEADVAARLLDVRHRCRWLQAIVVTGAAPTGTHRLDDLLAKASAVREAAPTTGEDIMYWGYTSGSTGSPKAAVHGHTDFVAAAELVGVGIFGLTADDLTFSASKMYFAFGLGNTLYFPARVGGASVLVPERPDPVRTLEIITSERPTVFFAVPTLYARILHVPDADRRFDLSSLRLCVSSGEALPPAVFDSWRARFGLELVDVVGATETLHDFIANRPGAVRRGSAGLVIPGFEAKLVDDVGAPVPPGVVGHLLVKGPTTSPYYWNRLERTRATMLGEWLRTGDMFARDADGYFYFAGRSDDMLKVGGIWVSPMEVEACLLAHPAVSQAVVVATHDGDGLEKPVAYVILEPGQAAGATVTEEELVEHCRAALPSFKRPRKVIFTSAYPTTATGKVRRVELRAMAATVLL